MDIELHCEERGEGFPLVLLHGNGEDGSYFSRQMEYFSGSYRVVAVDTRGHGSSPRGTAPFTLEQFAEDLKEFLDEKGLTRIHLLGFSDGANVALLFSLKYPRYVEKLILNGGNLDPSGVRRAVQWPICAAYALVCLIARFDAGAAPKKELLGLMTTQPHIDPAALSAMAMPVLVVAGERDMIKRTHTRRIHAAIPGAVLAILPGDHFVANKNSGVFNQTVEDFLREKHRP